MKKTVSRIATTLISLGVALIVLIAIAIGVVRELVLQADDFRPDLVELVERKSGLQFEIDSLQGSWTGLAPRFRMGGVELRTGEGQRVAYSEKIDLEILLLRSLWNLQPRFRLQLDGVQLQTRYEDGQLKIVGFTADTTSASPEEMQRLVDLLSSQPLLALSNSRIGVIGLYDTPVALRVSRIQSEAAEHRRYLRGRFSVAGPSALAFEMRGRVTGSLFQRHGISGNLYLESRNANWLPWIPTEHRKLAQAELKSLQAGGKFWLKLKRGSLDEIVSSFSASKVELSSDNDVQPPYIQQLTTRLRWRGQINDEWKLELQDMNMQTKRFDWRPNRLSLFAQQQTADTTLYRIIADDVDIEPWVNYYLGIEEKDNKVRQTLSKLRPSGKVRDLNLELVLKEDQIADYRFGFSLNGFENRPWKKWPGLHDLDLKAWGKEGMFLVKLDDDRLELNYPWLFRDHIVLHSVQGNLRLLNTDSGFQLQSDPIQARTGDVQGVTQLSLELPKDKAISPFIRLQTTLRNGDGSKASTYLPAGVLQSDLLAWLDQAIMGGHLLRGDIIAHGPIRKGTPEKRTVLLGFTANDATFRFLPDWEEPIREGEADVIIDRGAVEVHATTGRYFDQQIVQANVSLPRYHSKRTHMLTVQGETRGKAETGVNVLKQTPLSQYVGEVAQDMTLSGNLGVNLRLDAPLHKVSDETLRVRADIDVGNGTLNLLSQNVQIDDLNGQMVFDLDKGLQGENITGRVFGGDILGEITTTRQDRGQQIQVNLSGEADLALLELWQPSPFWKTVKGRLPYQFGLYIPLGEMQQQHPPYFQVQSELQGVQLDFPAPFFKAAETTKPFTLRMGLGNGTKEWQVKYDQRLSAIGQWNDQQLVKAMLRLGPGNVSLPPQNRIVVQGTLSELDDARWRDWFQRMNAREADEITVVSREPDLSLLHRLDDSAVRIERLVLGGTVLGRTDLSVKRSEQGWRCWVDNPKVKGVADLPFYMAGSPELYSQQNAPVKVDIASLVLPEDDKTDEEKKTAQQNWRPMNLSPKRLPPMDLRIQAFKLGERDLGRWDVQLKPTAQGLDLASISAQIQGVSITGAGKWNETESGNRYSIANIHLRAANAADVMRVWGATPTLSSKSAKADMQLSWSGAPFEMALSRTRGDITASLEDGVFYNVSNNAAGKLWGALNFETLLRRLQLNFDDLRESDMVYDEINARLSLNRGDIHLQNMNLDSPSIKMGASGNINMEQNTLDMGLDVTVPITRNLVLPAAVIGGVPAAATVFVVEKVLGSQFDKLTTIKYAVNGPFESPRISVKDSFSIIPKQVGEAVIGNEEKAVQGAQP